jgi:hypothetical protein
MDPPFETSAEFRAQDNTKECIVLKYFQEFLRLPAVQMFPLEKENRQR